MLQTYYFLIVDRRELTKLRRELKRTKRNALAEGTTKNILVQWKAFNDFCDKFNLHDWPASTETLCLFAQHLARRMRSVKTVQAYLYGVVQLHLYAGITPPDINHFQVKLTIRGIRRFLKHRVQQCKPMTPVLLLKIHKLLNFNNVNDTVFWAVLLTGFYLLLRKSNLVPDNQSSFNRTKHLTKGQVQLNKNFVRVKITWSKTIQFEQRVLYLKMFRLRNSDLCPVQAFKRLFAVTNPKDKQSCFLDNSGLPFSYGMLNYRIKKYLKLAGVRKFYRYSAHSLRREGLLAGFKAGLPRELLKCLGDWRSDCFQVYLSFPRQVREQAGKRVRDSLKKFVT